MKVFLAIPIMLIVGLSLGAGGATLLWSGMHSRATAQTQRALDLASTWEKLANENRDGWKQCLAIARRL